MGAWIEIDLWGQIYKTVGVAPYVGAWIEITEGAGIATVERVAPYVGAWIEILFFLACPGLTMSLPMWERGLK